MRLLAIAAALITTMLAAAGTAGADPPPPSEPPGYQIPTPSGAQFPGAETYPPRCLSAMLSCGFRYDAGTGTWNAPQPSE